MSPRAEPAQAGKGGELAPPLLEWRAVRVAFGTRVVLDDFQLALRRGECLAILGGSGEGKSVALRLAVGLLRPDRGEVLFAGRVVGAGGEAELRSLRRRLGMVFQAGALFDSLSVAENVAFGIQEHEPRCRQPELAARVREALGLVGLGPEVEEQLPQSLSGGMRKRVALARALAVGPEILLHDEPTAGLDPSTTRRVNRLIRELQGRLAASVVVTHDLPSAFEVADRIALLRRGRIVFEGSAAEARDRPPAALAAFMAGEE